MLESSKKIKKSQKKSTKKRAASSDESESSDVEQVNHSKKAKLNLKFEKTIQIEEPIRDIYKTTRRAFTTSLVIPSSIVDNA
jgi:hypothetical protein